MYNSQLETFIKVADAGSFSKASELLYISSTAVIKQINSLEEKLNLTLFHRTHRGLTLTAAGASLYEDAKFMIRYGKESVARAEEAMRAEESVVRIGSSPMTPAQILVRLWPKIHDIYPNLKFKVIPFENTPDNARSILKTLGSQIDVVAGIFDEALQELDYCKAIELYREPVCAAVALNHPLADREFLTPEDLRGQNLLLIREGQIQQVDTLRHDLIAHEPDIHITDFDFYDTDIFNVCEDGEHILMAVESWENVHPLIRIIPIEWDYTIPYGLLYPKNPPHNIQVFIDAIKKIYHTK